MGNFGDADVGGVEAGAEDKGGMVGGWGLRGGMIESIDGVMDVRGRTDHRETIDGRGRSGFAMIDGIATGMKGVVAGTEMEMRGERGPREGIWAGTMETEDVTTNVTAMTMGKNERAIEMIKVVNQSVNE